MQTKRILIIASEFNKNICASLVEGAKRACTAGGITAKNITVIWVPGAFEIPTAIAAGAESKKWDAILSIGCVIKGETAHFEYISSAVSQQIAALGVKYQIPITFGVLTTYTLEQALARSGLLSVGVADESPQAKHKHENKGEEAAEAALAMIKTLQYIREA